MRALIFAALSVSVLAEESSFSASVQFLKESAKGLDLGSTGYSSGVAKGRQLVLQSILSEVESYNSLSPAAVTALDPIPALLDAILLEIAAARDADNAIADTYPALFAACTDPTNAEQVADSAALTASNNAMTALENCATELATDQGTYDADCGALQTMLNTLTTLVCVVPGASGPASTQDDADLWISVTTTVTQNFGNPTTDGWHQQFEALRPACDAAKAALTSQLSSCYSLHSAFNTAYCSFAQARTARCSQEDTCYSGHQTDASAFNTAQAGRADQRENDAQVIASLRCLIQEMIDHPTGNDLDSWRASCAATRSADYSSYRGYQATIPGQVVCPDGGVPASPGPIVWATVYDTATVTEAVFDAALDPTATNPTCTY
jgi:hypothetical protein